MKVSATGPVGSPAVQRSSRSTGGTGAFALEKSCEAKGPAPVSGAATIAAIDAIITLQSVPDATTGRARAIKRADSMLDLLDQIRIGLLEGSISEGLLKRLVVLVQSRREDFNDPHLAQVLDDIDLRAQVELAKFNQSF
jgi:hypothetical protein